MIECAVQCKQRKGRQNLRGDDRTRCARRATDRHERSRTAQSGSPHQVVRPQRALRGTEFDTLWVASMVASDQGALDVASTELTTGKNVDAISLTKQIVAALNAEIGQLRQLAG